MEGHTIFQGGDAFKGDAKVVWVEEACGVVEKLYVLESGCKYDDYQQQFFLRLTRMVTMDMMTGPIGIEERMAEQGRGKMRAGETRTLNATVSGSERAGARLVTVVTQRVTPRIRSRTRDRIHFGRAWDGN